MTQCNKDANVPSTKMPSAASIPPPPPPFFLFTPLLTKFYLHQSQTIAFKHLSSALATCKSLKQFYKRISIDSIGSIVYSSPGVTVAVWLEKPPGAQVGHQVNVKAISKGNLPTVCFTGHAPGIKVL